MDVNVNLQNEATNQHQTNLRQRILVADDDPAKRGDYIPTTSGTAKFQKIPANVAGGVKANAFTMLDDWFDGAPRIELTTSKNVR